MQYAISVTGEMMKYNALISHSIEVFLSQFVPGPPAKREWTQMQTPQTPGEKRKIQDHDTFPLKRYFHLPPGLLFLVWIMLTVACKVVSLQVSGKGRRQVFSSNNCQPANSLPNDLSP